MSNIESNGSYVSRAELAAHVKGIDEHFDTLELDVKAIRFDMRELHTELQTGFRLMQERSTASDAAAEDRLWLGPMGHRFLTSGSLLCALVALIVAVFFK